MRRWLPALLIDRPMASQVAAAGCGGSDNKITIGTKFDQPGLAVKKPDGSMAGFDVDVATWHVASNSVVTPEQIE